MDRRVIDKITSLVRSEVADSKAKYDREASGDNIIEKRVAYARWQEAQLILRIIQANSN